MRPWTSLILPEVEEALARGDLDAVRAALEDLLAPDVADFLAHLPSDAAAKLIGALDVVRASAVFAELEAARQRELFESLGRERFGRIIGEMNPDDRVDLVKRLPEETRRALLPLLAQAERNDVRRLLEYPEGTAGALMTTEYVALPGDLHVDEALARLREVAPDSETIYYVYVIDAERRLRGVASLREIITALPRKPLREIMREHPVVVRVDDDQEAVAEAFKKYDLSTIPVLDRDGRLVGIITVDDVIDVIEEEHTEDVQRLGGMTPLEEPYMQTGFARLLRKRALWLVVIFLGELATASVLARQEEAFKAVAALVIFIPLVISSGGNSGSQSATLVTRAVAVGEIAPRDFLRVLKREFLMCVALGLILGAVGAVRAFLGGHRDISLVVGVALVAVVLWGGVTGAMIPLALKRAGLDPAVSSAPLIATLVDVAGIFIYFHVAEWLLHLP